MAIHRNPDHIFKEYGLTRAKKQHNPAHRTPIGRTEPQFDRLVRRGIAIRAVAPEHRTFAERGIVRAGERLRSGAGAGGRGRRTGGSLPRVAIRGVAPGSRTDFEKRIAARDVREARAGGGIQRRRRGGGILPPSPFGGGVSSSFGSQRRRPLRRHRARR